MTATATAIDSEHRIQEEVPAELEWDAGMVDT